jgi:uncharacterized protein (TIGR03435 family)
MPMLRASLLPRQLRNKLGLKIAERKHPMPVLVVDSVNRAPTPNAPGVEKVLGVPTEFEAASVKPTRPGNPVRKFQVNRGPRDSRKRNTQDPDRDLSKSVSNRGCSTIRSLRVGGDFERDMIVGGPKWIETEGFDIIATAEVTTPYSPEWIPDHVGVMLRALLAERFKLATHTEQRPVPVWTLSWERRG